MKFLFVEVKQNNDKFVALFRSEDQSRDVYIAANNSNFSQFTVGHTYTLTFTEEIVEEVNQSASV